MPRVAIDYSKTIIYRISHKEIEGLDYVGSTTDFTRRKAEHKYNYTSSKSTHQHYKVYETIKANGGWDAFRMLEIKKFPCADKREAEAEEERCRKELNATLNTHRAFITEAERKAEISEYKKQYNESNKEKIRESRKLYRELNPEKIREQKKAYSDQNKDKINEKGKLYYDEHKEQISAYQKEYRERKYTCECCLLSLKVKSKVSHEKTERHLKNELLKEGHAL